MRPLCWIAMLIILLTSVETGATGFRTLNEIATPPKNTGATTVPASPVAYELVQNAVEKLLTAWNTGTLDQWLGDDFYDRWRLLDAITEDVPRDAVIRILAVESISTLSQTITADPQSLAVDVVTSLVAATVRTQIEYNDPNTGFQRLDGTNKFIFRVTQKRFQETK